MCVACPNQHFNGIILTNFPTWGGQRLVNQYVRKSMNKVKVGLEVVVVNTVVAVTVNVAVVVITLNVELL